MSVLTLAGKPIDWAHPPAPTTKVMWSQRTSGGKPVTGSLRTIAFIDHLSILAMKKYNTGIRVQRGHPRLRRLLRLGHPQRTAR